MQTVHLIISGKVQGVFFRATAKKMADHYKIKGWIKNTFDKKVETKFTGEAKQVEQFINWCKAGPPKAVVTDVVMDVLPETKFLDFEIMR